MKYGFCLIPILVAVTACTPTVPDSGQGVGFSDYADYELERARREAALTGGRSVQPASGQPALSGGLAPLPQGIGRSDLQAAGIGQQANTGAPLSALSPQQPIAQSPASSNPSISDENDFSAVSSRETIESDAQRLAAAAAQRQQAPVTALPTRPGNSGPNIVEYALNAPNRKGQEWYSRSLLSGQGRFERNCVQYNSPDAAQRDFLARGGPERDPRGIDPDGDGFACGWDPAPFRLAAGN